MKYQTSEYRKLLCLYQQLQQPEPVLFSRSLREHHVLFLSDTPQLTLYFTRQGKRYWLVNEYDFFELNAFRYNAGTPGHFFTRALKNTLRVKLHRVLDNNDYALSLCHPLVIEEVSQVFDELVRRFHQPSPAAFTLHRTVSADNRMLVHRDPEWGITLTLRCSGLGYLTLEMAITYSPLPFTRYQATWQVKQHHEGHSLSAQTCDVLKTQLCRQVPHLTHRFFHYA